jgi:hypothetical protein
VGSVRSWRSDEWSIASQTSVTAYPPGDRRGQPGPVRSVHIVRGSRYFTKGAARHGVSHRSDQARWADRIAGPGQQQRCTADIRSAGQANVTTGVDDRAKRPAPALGHRPGVGDAVGIDKIRGQILERFDRVVDHVLDPVELTRGRCGDPTGRAPGGGAPPPPPPPQVTTESARRGSSAAISKATSPPSLKPTR